jgi:hypothetical protein
MKVRFPEQKNKYSRLNTLVNPYTMKQWRSIRHGDHLLRCHVIHLEEGMLGNLCHIVGIPAGRRTMRYWFYSAT